MRIQAEILLCLEPKQVKGNKKNQKKKKPYFAMPYLLITPEMILEIIRK
jgi:hypothetical protein